MLCDIIFHDIIIGRIMDGAALMQTLDSEFANILENESKTFSQIGNFNLGESSDYAAFLLICTVYCIMTMGRPLI